jgi:hypothetical protein
MEDEREAFLTQAIQAIERHVHDKSADEAIS